MCFEICDQLLGSLNHQQEVLFIVDYALKYLTIPDGKLEEYELLKIGSKVKTCNIYMVWSPHEGVWYFVIPFIFYWCVSVFP